MSQVNLILIESVHSLGEAGDLVRVKPGYARNYLLPQGKAILATEGRVKELEHHKRIAAEKAAREFQNLQLAKQKLESLTLETTARAGTEGKLFGSVTAVQVAELLAAQGVEMDRRRIDMEPIKELGEHVVRIRLHRDLAAQVTVKVAADGTTVSPEDEPEEEEARDRGRRRRHDDDDEDDEERPADSGD